jgi:hypothetical protein
MRDEDELTIDDNPIKVIAQSAAIIISICFALGLIFWGVTRLLRHEKPLTPAELVEKRQREIEAAKQNAEQMEQSAKEVARLALHLVSAVVVLGYLGAMFACAAFIARDATCRGHVGVAWVSLFLGIQFALRPFVLAVATAVAILPMIMGSVGAALVVFPAVEMFSWSGLFIYLYSRSSGSMTRCDDCSQRRLHYLLVCPRCGRKS